jgi:hypothetical protein
MASVRVKPSPPKSLVLIIRCHGEIILRGENERNGPEIQKKIELFKFIEHVKEISIVSLAKLGEKCYGSPKLKEYVEKVKYYYDNFIDADNVGYYPSSAEVVTDLFLTSKPHHDLTITQQKNELFEDDVAELVKLPKEYTINKRYTDRINNKEAGIFYLNSDKFNPKEIKEIEELLKVLTEQIKNGGLFRSEIIQKLTKYKIDHLYLIDLTCNEFTKYDIRGATRGYDEELKQYLYAENLRGGIRKNDTKKSKKSRKTRKLKPRQKRKRLLL